MYIKVHVTQKAKKEQMEQESDDHFRIHVKEPAQRNMANKKVVEMLSKYFGVSIKDVRIVNGHHHPHKLVRIDKESPKL